MERTDLSVRNWPATIAAAALPALLFELVLWLPMPASFSRPFSAYSTPFFLITLLLYFGCFRLDGMKGWIAAACLTMLLLGLTLSFLWSSGYSDDKIIAGLVPFRDGFDYYNGAKLILGGRSISNLNEGAAWRPLYPGFLSALLWLTGSNLQWSLAIQVGLAGFCFVLSAYLLRNLIGAAGAAVYMTLLYFYIQPLIGTAYTETLGVAAGCLGFVLLCAAATTKRSWSLVAGLAVLMLAVSERAGAFFIFPLLIMWAGWAFRQGMRYSWKHAGLAALTVAATYLVVNTLFRTLIVEPGGFPFGNFSFTIYGQVVGGAGYHKAFEDLSVRNPALILRAAERFFLAHPGSFFIGAAKAYRDFFSPQLGVLSFDSGVPGLAVWFAASVLLLAGLYLSARRISTPESSMLLAGFLGIFLSVPFLPPIDGGIRIYASTMPFVYALPAVAAARWLPGKQPDEMDGGVILPAWMLSVVVMLLTVIAPVLILHLTSKIVAAAQSCAAGQVPYATLFSAGSYVDLVPDQAGACGRVPEVCLRDFGGYSRSNDPSDAAVYEVLITRAQLSAARVFAADDLISGRPHLFVGARDDLKVDNNSVITGCASETVVKGRPSIYSVQTIIPASFVE